MAGRRYREGISEALRLAAVALGYPAHLVASHSLRKGGATAMLAVTSDVETVKRFGGWKSDAVHAYLYTDMAAAPNRAKEMLTSKPVLQPQQHTQAPNRVGCRSLDCVQPADVRCGGPEDPRAMTQTGAPPGQNSRILNASLVSRGFRGFG